MPCWRERRVAGRVARWRSRRLAHFLPRPRELQCAAHPRSRRGELPIPGAPPCRKGEPETSLVPEELWGCSIRVPLAPRARFLPRDGGFQREFFLENSELRPRGRGWPAAS